MSQQHTPRVLIKTTHYHLVDIEPDVLANPDIDLGQWAEDVENWSTWPTYAQYDCAMVPLKVDASSDFPLLDWEEVEPSPLKKGIYYICDKNFAVSEFGSVDEAIRTKIGELWKSGE